MRKFQKFVNEHKISFSVIVFLFFIIIGCCTFPIINTTKEYSNYISIINIVTTIALYVELGKFEAYIFKQISYLKIAVLNFGLVVLSMICRYLLEFGEVSNTYNFTLYNILIHILITMAISLLACNQSKSTKE